MYNNFRITDNIYVQDLVVYGVNGLFLLCLLPVYTSVYLYADAGRAYFSVDAYLWRFIHPLQLSTADDGGMRLNGGDLNIGPVAATRAAKVAFDNLCLFKLVQLSDFGLKSGAAAYAALFQRAATFALYKYAELSGSRCKLRNYAVFNAEHGNVVWCGKAVCAVNVVAAAKLLICVLREIGNEDKG